MKDGSRRIASAAFPLAVFLLAAASCLRYVPDLLSFTAIVFGDAGWPLSVDALLDDGMIPTRDFGYFYGLLALAIDRAWFALVGRTPEAVAGLIGVGSFFIAVGLVRFAHAARLGPWARVVLLAAVPMAVMPLPYPTPLHAIEAALLINALAFQVRGRYGAALVLATLAVFVKPGLAYFHGLLLVSLVLGGYGCEAGWRGRLKTFAPAAVTGLAIALGLIVWLGPAPLLHTLVPTSAAQTYDQENFGFFFGDGRQFWLPDAMHNLFHLLTPAGFWLLASLVLGIAAVRKLPRLRDPASATVVTCAVLHAVFVLFLFGNRWSWLYYSAILVCGLAAALPEPQPGQSKGRPRGRVLPGALAFLALVGQFGPIEFALGHWKEQRRFERTASLFALPADAAAWSGVRDRARHEKVMVFANAGAAFVVFSEVDSPRVWFLLRSTATPADIERVQTQLRSANLLVLPHAGLFPNWPEFSQELEAFQPVSEAQSFKVHRRGSAENPAK